MLQTQDKSVSLKRIIELLCKRSIEVKKVRIMRTLHIRCMPSKNLEYIFISVLALFLHFLCTINNLRISSIVRVIVLKIIDPFRPFFQSLFSKIALYFDKKRSNLNAFTAGKNQITSFALDDIHSL